MPTNPVSGGKKDWKHQQSLVKLLFIRAADSRSSAIRELMAKVEEATPLVLDEHKSLFQNAPEL